MGVLVANVLTRQLLWLLQDLKQQAPGDESPYLVDKAGLVLMSANPRVRLLSAPADVQAEELRAAMGSAKNGHLVYTDSRGHKLDGRLHWFGDLWRQQYWRLAANQLGLLRRPS